MTDHNSEETKNAPDNEDVSRPDRHTSVAGNNPIIPEETLENILRDLCNEHWDCGDECLQKQVNFETLDHISRMIDEIIGPDEDASWQKIWDGSKSKGNRIQTIDDPGITAQNRLKAEQRERKSKLIGGGK